MMVADRSAPAFAARVSANTFAADVARTASQRRQAYRLRYDVYIAEQGKRYKEADHDERLFIDELDREAAILLVTQNGEAAGTVRANWFSSASVRRMYADSVQQQRFSAIDDDKTWICSRLAVAATCRDQRARSALFETIYEIAVTRGTQLCFATCAPILLRLFRGYGFREYAPPLADPIVGTLHRTLLVLDDLTHLAQVKSPFVAIAERHRLSAVERPWLNQIFSDYRAARGAR